MINWQYYPKRKEIPAHLKDLVDIFVLNQGVISSDDFTLNSNDVLEKISLNLLELNYQVEVSKKAIDKIKVPVLFGMNGKLESQRQTECTRRSMKHWPRSRGSKPWVARPRTRVFRART